MNEQAGWGWPSVKGKWPVPSSVDPAIGCDGEGDFAVVNHQGFHGTSWFVKTRVKLSWVVKDSFEYQLCE